MMFYLIVKNESSGSGQIFKNYSNILVNFIDHSGLKSLLKVKPLLIKQTLIKTRSILQKILFRLMEKQSTDSIKQKQVCSHCGNIHSGQCSTEPIFFYWLPSPNELKAPKQVQLVGSWHKWQSHQHMIRQINTEGEVYFQLALNLPVGKYQYKYYVDGIWRHDPSAPCEPDPFGGWNNTVQILPKKTYMEYADDHKNIKISSVIAAENLKIVGSWDNWLKQIPMKKVYNSLKGCEENVVYLKLDPNTPYQFKFKLGKQYFIDQKYPTVCNKFGSTNNRIIPITQKFDTPISRKNVRVQSKQLSCKYFEWQKMPLSDDLLPFQRLQGHTMCSIGQYIYIFGGMYRSQFIGTLFKISIHNYENMELLQFSPNPRAFHNMVTYGNKILIYGGHNNTILHDYYSFNVTEGSWLCTQDISGKDLDNREKLTCVIYGMSLVFYGGYYCTKNIQLQSVFSDIHVLDIEKMKWIEVHVKGEVPPGRFSHTATMIGSNMYIFGGKTISPENQSYVLNDIWRINLQSVNQLVWQEIKIKGTKPKGRLGHTMNALEHFLVIYGGKGGKGDQQLYSDVVVFDTKTNQWIFPIINGEAPRPRYHHASTIVQGQTIVIFGGRVKDKKKTENIYLLRPKQYKPKLNILEEDDDNEIDDEQSPQKKAEDKDPEHCWKQIL